MQRDSRADLVTGQRRRDRFIGVLDPSTGATQKDVKNDLLCKSNSVIDEPEWPFDNIAVFTVNKSARRSRGGCRGSGLRSDRVFDQPGKLKPAMQAFNQVVDTGLFQSVEWDAVVTVASPDRSSMQVSESSFLADIFAA